MGVTARAASLVVGPIRMTCAEYKDHGHHGLVSVYHVAPDLRRGRLPEDVEDLAEVGEVEAVEEACLDMLEKAEAKDFELITMFYGEDLNATEANRISDKVREAYPGQEIEIQDGGQPHYQFIISVE